MASAIRQIKFVDTTLGSASAASILGTFDSAVLKGSTLAVLGQNNDPGGGVTSVLSDDVNGPWPVAIEDINDTDPSAQTHLRLFCFQNTNAGIPTVLDTFSGTTNFRALAILEISGVRAASLDKHTGQIQAAPGTGANAVTSGNTATLTAQPNIVIAFSMNTNDSAGPPNTGTGYSNPSPAVGWAWDLGFNTLRIEFKNTTATTAVAGTFTAIVGTARFTTIVLVLLDGGPTISVQPTPQTVCAGQTATFSVTATGTGTVHYQWRKNGVNVGTDSSSYTTPATTTADSGASYDCVLTDDAFNTTSTAVALTVKVCPALAWLRG